MSKCLFECLNEIKDTFLDIFYKPSLQTSWIHSDSLSSRKGKASLAAAVHFGSDCWNIEAGVCNSSIQLMKMHSNFPENYTINWIRDLSIVAYSFIEDNLLTLLCDTFSFASSLPSRNVHPSRCLIFNDRFQEILNNRKLFVAKNVARSWGMKGLKALAKLATAKIN